MKPKHTNKCIIINCHKYSEERKCGISVVSDDSRRKTSFKMKLCLYSHTLMNRKDKSLRLSVKTREKDSVMKTSLNQVHHQKS